MPAPRCVDGQGDPIPCLLNQYIQYVNYTDPARAMTDHSWDGLANGLYTAPLFFNAAAAGSSGSGGSGGSGSGGSPDGGNPDGGSGGSGGTVTACPGSTCAQNGSCQGSQNECCGISFCADTDTPQGDPPDAAASLFHGSKPEAQEHMGRTPGANPRCGHVPDMHCGSYVLWVYLNTGTGSGLARFASTPKIVHSPVPLESDQMTSDQGVGAMANASAWRATADLDGDGLPDAVYQTPDDLIPVSGFSERRFRVWFGDGQGAFRGGNLGGRLWNTPPRDVCQPASDHRDLVHGGHAPGPRRRYPVLAEDADEHRKHVS